MSPAPSENAGRVPRVSGDEPGLVIGASSNDESSPRKRGGASLGVGLIPL